MKFTTAVALSFGVEALASASSSTYDFGKGFGTCTSSTCHSGTGGLSSGSTVSPTGTAAGTATGTWSVWSTDPADPTTKSTTSTSSTTTWGTWSSDPAKAVTTSSTTSWGTWSADPKKTSTSTSSTTVWGTWSADPAKSSSTSTSWGTWSADPAKSSSTSTVWGSWNADPAKASSTSTAWGSWSADPHAATTATAKAAVASSCGACASYVYNGDSWGFPSCADGVKAASASTSGAKGGLGSGTGSGWGSGSASSPSVSVSAGSGTGSGWGSGSASGSSVSAGSGTKDGWGSDGSNTHGANRGFLSTVSGASYPTTISQITKSWTVAPSGTSSPTSSSQTPVADNSCNKAGNRGSWCNGLSINTDQYTTYPDTGHVCEYDFTISSVEWDFEGTKRPALAVNGQVPGPAIVCDWGDKVKITVHNALTDQPTSIHWHGIRQLNTNDQDGVAGVTECGLAPGDSRVYEFHATSHGSSWYHSHFSTQYSDGVQGPIIIRGPTSADYDVDMGSVMVTDLFNVTAAEEYNKIVHQGPLGSSNYMLNGHNAKPDLSAGTHSLWEVEAGKKYLFRFVNSAAQSGWRVAIDGHSMTVIATDFVPIKPYDTKFLDISIGQRYDVIIETNQAVGSYFLRAATQGACPSTCDNTAFGLANGIIKYKGASNALPSSSPSFTPGDVAGICQDEALESLVPVVTKSAGSTSAFAAQASTLPAGKFNPVVSADDGTVFRWYLNGNTMNINPGLTTHQQLASAANATANGTYSDAENVAVITQGANQWVYFVIQNEFFVPHPMHLHGHDFSILGQGHGPFSAGLIGALNFDSPPRRDTAMLYPQGYTVIGFQADNPGAWLMHCHIAWHASGGLAMQFLERPSEIPAASYAASEKGQCDKYNAFATSAPFKLLSGDSGLKVRREDMADYSADVVRRSEKSSKRYLSQNLRRGLGDSHHQHGHY